MMDETLKKGFFLPLGQAEGVWPVAQTQRMSVGRGPDFNDVEAHGQPWPSERPQISLRRPS